MNAKALAVLRVLMERQPGTKAALIGGLRRAGVKLAPYRLETLTSELEEDELLVFDHDRGVFVAGYHSAASLLEGELGGLHRELRHLQQRENELVRLIEELHAHPLPKRSVDVPDIKGLSRHVFLVSRRDFDAHMNEFDWPPEAAGEWVGLLCKD